MAATAPSGVSALMAIANGQPLFLGKIAAGASTITDNATTASAFTITGGSRIWLQGDAAFYVEVIAAASMTAAGAKAILVEANQVFPIGLLAGATKVSVLGVAGAVNVKVFQMTA
jgi:hypothetical protein